MVNEFKGRTFVGRAFAGLSPRGAFTRPAKAKQVSIPVLTFKRTGVKMEGPDLEYWKRG